MKIRNNIAISDSGFVFDSNNGESFTLNKIGLEILQMLKNSRTEEEITQKIVKKYDVDIETFEQNYFDFVGMLRHFNLFENESF